MALGVMVTQAIVLRVTVRLLAHLSSGFWDWWHGNSEHKGSEIPSDCQPISVIGLRSQQFLTQQWL